MKFYQRMAQAVRDARVGKTRAIQVQGETLIESYTNELFHEGVSLARMVGPVTEFELDLLLSSDNKLFFRGATGQGRFRVIVRPSLINEVSVQVVGQIGGTSRINLTEAIADVLKGE